VRDDTLYAFLGSGSVVTRADIDQMLKDYGVRDDLINPIVGLLLWYGFLGIELDDGTRKYIYDFNYKMPVMNGLIRKKGSELRYPINEAFWPALLIDA
jgi:hypothetical protein